MKWIRKCHRCKKETVSERQFGTVTCNICVKLPKRKSKALYVSKRC